VVKNRFGTEMTVREWLLSELQRFEQCARAAGHGGTDRIPSPLNAEWVQLDLRDNVRPTYDVNYLTLVVQPGVIADAILALIDLVELHVPASHHGSCMHCAEDASADQPCLSVKYAAQILADLPEFPDELRIDAGMRHGSIKLAEFRRKQAESWGS
jgi:hypothetical protein